MMKRTCHVTIDCYITLGTERETVYPVERLIDDLDSASVDKAVIAPSDREIAVLNRKGNSRILASAADFPDRLIPACTVNPWFGGEAVEELRHAAGEGAQMFVLNPALQGYLINDTLTDPVIETAAETGLPVYVHTGSHLYGAPWQLVDTALRHPDAVFIMGHSGATDYWNDVPAAGSYSDNIYLEGSFARPFSFKSHLDAAGIWRGIMGSAAPRNSLVFEWEQYRKELSAAEYEPVFGATIASLLPGKGQWR